jgi:sugar (pentulose or hexulose) kinase
MIPPDRAQPSTGPERVAVFDVGKTNAKLVVVEMKSGRECASYRMTNRVRTDGPYPHYDTDALWTFLIDALKAAAVTPGFDAMSVTTHGAAAALLDETGALALPVLDYEHAYSPEIVAAYDGIRPAFSETFSPRLAMGLNLGAQIHYQKTAFPAAFARVRTIVTYAQYWSGRLSGVFCNEVTSLGCHTDLWNPALGKASSLVGTLGLARLLAPVRPAFATLGPLRAPLAADIGLAPGRQVPVHCGLHDSNASLLPHLMARAAPFSVVSTGTWVVSFGVGGDLARLDPARDTLANVDAYGRPVPSARFMGGREYEMLTASPEPLEPVEPAAARAAVAVVIDKGLMLLPSVVPGCGPFPQARAEWVGGAQASAAERHAAICLYLALMTQESLSLLAAGGPILVEGPFARNPLYLSALAAFSGRPVEAIAGSTGTAQGAARLAAETGLAPAALLESDGPAILPLHVGSYGDLWRARIAERPRGILDLA